MGGGEQQKLSLVYNNAVVDYTGVHFSRCHYGTARCNPEMSGWRAYIILDGVEAATELKFMSWCMYVCMPCMFIQLSRPCSAAALRNSHGGTGACSLDEERKGKRADSNKALSCVWCGATFKSTAVHFNLLPHP